MMDHNYLPAGFGMRAIGRENDLDELMFVLDASKYSLENMKHDVLYVLPRK